MKFWPCKALLLCTKLWPAEGCMNQGMCQLELLSNGSQGWGTLALFLHFNWNSMLFFFSSLQSQQKCIVIFALVCCFAVLVALIFSAVDVWGEDEDGITEENCSKNCRWEMQNIKDKIWNVLNVGDPPITSVVFDVMFIWACLWAVFIGWSRFIAFMPLILCSFSHLSIPPLLDARNSDYLSLVLNRKSVLCCHRGGLTQSHEIQPTLEKLCALLHCLH